jgi:hypothetical protein
MQESKRITSWHFIFILLGAAGLIGRWRPRLTVAVFKPHTSAFVKWARLNAYRSVRGFPDVNAVNSVVEPLP